MFSSSITILSLLGNVCDDDNDGDDDGDQNDHDCIANSVFV